MTLNMAGDAMAKLGLHKWALLCDSYADTPYVTPFTWNGCSLGAAREPTPELSVPAAGGCVRERERNGDGLTILGEYAHGFDPLSPYNRPLSQVAPILVDGEEYLSIRYLIDPLAGRFVTIHVERSPDISETGGWERGRTVIVSSEASSEVPGLVEIVTRSLTPISSQPREFLRFAYEPKAP